MQLKAKAVFDNCCSISFCRRLIECKQKDSVTALQEAKIPVKFACTDNPFSDYLTRSIERDNKRTINKQAQSRHNNKCFVFPSPATGVVKFGLNERVGGLLRHQAQTPANISLTHRPNGSPGDQLTTAALAVTVATASPSAPNSCSIRSPSSS